MKSKLIIAITLIISFSTTHISAYSNRPSSPSSSIKRKDAAKHITIHGKRITKKPEYYRPGKSDGLQNWPGKTIDAGMNTGMLSTNSASYSGNDVSF